VAALAAEFLLKHIFFNTGNCNLKDIVVSLDTKGADDLHK
jgi:hypothetical protein